MEEKSMNNMEKALEKLKDATSIAMLLEDELTIGKEDDCLVRTVHIMRGILKDAISCLEQEEKKTTGKI